MKINHVWIKGFRNIQETDFEVGDQLVLIGDNNSGKTNVLKAITLPMASGENYYSQSVSFADINNNDKEKYYKFIIENIAGITEQSVSPALNKKWLNVIPEIHVRLQFEVTEATRYYFEKLCTTNDQDELVYQLEYCYKIQDMEKLRRHLSDVRDRINNDIEQYKMNLLPDSLYKSSIYIPNKNEPVTYELLRNLKHYSLAAERDGFSSKSSKVGSAAIIDLLNRNIDNDSKLNIEKGYRNFFEQIKNSANMAEVFNWPKNSIYENAEDFFGEITILPNMSSINTLLNSVQLGYADEPLSHQGLGYRNIVYLMAMINALESNNENPFSLLTLEEPEAHLSNENQKLMMSFLESTSKENCNIQLMYSTHSTSFLPKLAFEDIVIMDEGNAVALRSTMDLTDIKYLMRNPNMDIYKLLFSKNVVLVEGISEELLIKAYLRTTDNKLNNIEVLSFHKGYKKILALWSKVNMNSSRKIAVIRDFDNQPKAEQETEGMGREGKIYIGTTAGYTLEDDIVRDNFVILKNYFNDEFGWDPNDFSNVNDLSSKWKSAKGHIMTTLCLALGTDELYNFKMPEHIRKALSFFMGE